LLVFCATCGVTFKSRKGVDEFRRVEAFVRPDRHALRAHQGLEQVFGGIPFRRARRGRRLHPDDHAMPILHHHMAHVGQLRFSAGAFAMRPGLRIPRRLMMV
jgi:hypothetical protein